MTHISATTRQAEQQERPLSTAPKAVRGGSRLAVLVLAVVAAAALACGSARADTVSFPVTGSPSILAPTYTGYGAVRVSTTCNRLNHSASVWLGVQAPSLLADGIWFEAWVYVKNHANPSFNGALYLAHVQKQVFPAGFSGGVQINGFTDAIKAYFNGTAGNAYDVGVWYRYGRPGMSWSQTLSFQATEYSIVVNAWGNQLGASTCWL